VYKWMGLNVAGRYIAQTVARFIWLILLALTGLFFIFDVIAEANEVGNGIYSMQKAAFYALLQIAAHVYDAMPIAVVAGAIVALASLANNSEITVLRSSSMTPLWLLKTLFLTGVPFVLFTLVIGEWVQPLASQKAELMRATALGYRMGSDLKSGVWLRDVQVEGGVNYINLPTVNADGTAPSINIYGFDTAMRLSHRISAQKGRFVDAQGATAQYWLFEAASVEKFDLITAQRISATKVLQWKWASTLSPNALVGMQKNPDRVGIVSLLETVLFQQKNDVDARKSMAILLRRLFHPLALWVMLVISLPFAYLRARGGAIASRVFAGVLMGMGFHSGNRLFEFMSLVQGWPVWLSAQLPLWCGLALAMVLFWRFHRLH
jgi:lipopolysaccharide export system permease protein